MTRALRIVAADDEQYMREYLSELLPRLGHQAIVAQDGRHLVRLCQTLEPDLVIVDIRMPDLDGLSAAEEVCRQRPVPVVVVSAHHDPALRERAVAGAAMAYLVKPIKEADLEAAIDVAVGRFERERGLRKEAAELKQALEDRKAIERAKGAVMRRIGVGEEDAYRRLRAIASQTNRKLADVAQQVLSAEETFQTLDRPEGR